MLPVMPALLNQPTVNEGNPAGGNIPAGQEKPGSGFAALLAIQSEGVVSGLTIQAEETDSSADLAGASPFAGELSKLEATAEPTLADISAQPPPHPVSPLVLANVPSPFGGGDTQESGRPGSMPGAVDVLAAVGPSISSASMQQLNGAAPVSAVPLQQINVTAAEGTNGVKVDNGRQAGGDPFFAAAANDRWQSRPGTRGGAPESMAETGPAGLLVAGQVESLSGSRSAAQVSGPWTGGFLTAQMLRPFNAGEIFNPALKQAKEGSIRLNSAALAEQFALFDLSQDNPAEMSLLKAAVAPARESALSLQFEQFLHPTGDEGSFAKSQEFTGNWTGFGSTYVEGGGLAKVAEVPPLPSAYLAKVGDQQIVDQVVSRVKLTGGSGDTNLSLVLHPKELGEVRVELISDKDGLKAHLHSQTQLVQEVLEKHLPRLREAFETQGLKIHDLQVSCDARRDGNGPFQQGQGFSHSSRNWAGSLAADARDDLKWSAEPPPIASGWSSQPGFSLRV